MAPAIWRLSVLSNANAPRCYLYVIKVFKPRDTKRRIAGDTVLRALAVSPQALRANAVVCRFVTP